MGGTITVKGLRQATGWTVKQFGEYFGIPERTVASWESDKPSGRECPAYLLQLMVYKLKTEQLLKNGKTPE